MKEQCRNCDYYRKKTRRSGHCTMVGVTTINEKGAYSRKCPLVPWKSRCDKFWKGPVFRDKERIDK